MDKLSESQQRAVRSLIKVLETEPEASITQAIFYVLDTTISSNDRKAYPRYTNSELAVACDKYSRMKQAAQSNYKCYSEDS